MIPLYDNQPTKRPPVLTLALIALNVFVFVGWQLRVGLAQSVQMAAFVPAELALGRDAGAIPDLFSSMFMHGGWMHLIGNMWFLWIFGNNIEDACGHFRFLIFYLLCGVAATMAHVVADPESMTPLVGASGAVSGVLGAYLLKHPHAQVRTLIPLGFLIRIVHLPAFLFLLFWIGIQILSEAASRVGPRQGGGVAYLAHIAGFVAGLVLIFVFQQRKRENTFDWRLPR
jgi:membrane associated rhomboid family serine protease